MPRGIENSKLRRGLIGGLVILPLVVAAAGCSSSSKDSGSTASGSGSESADSVLGPLNKATGSPILIGVNNPGKSAAIDVTIEDVAIQALVKYANDYMGGINGHVIQIKICETKDTPADQLDCANQAISAKVSAVIQASGDDNTIKTVAAAGIPVFEGLAASSIGLSTPGVFSMGNSIGTFGSPAAYAKELNAKNSSLIVIDVPAASGPAKQLAPGLFKNAGSALKVAAVAPGTADMTPQVTAASEPKPDLYWALGNPNFCTSAITAMKTVNPTAKIVMLANCISTEKTSIPGGYAGIKTVAATALDPASKDYKLFEAIQTKYDGAVTKEGKSVDSQAVFGYAPMMGLITALTAAKITDTSAAGVLAAIKSAPATPLPFGLGATFQCNGKQLKLSPNVCSVAGFIADTDKDGKLSNFTKLDDASVYNG